MSQSPAQESEFAFDGEYAEAARQLNKLVRSGKSYSGHERNCCYLNLSGERFANASMVSGFDFPEDGRAIAICDWDGDGDRDFWVANRTAPQIRFMQNLLADNSNANYVTFKLVGTQSNRDAIGARVRVRLGDPLNTTIAKTIRAGEGFLASGSKTVHIGMAEASQISSIEVDWPSGNRERFGAIRQVNQGFMLKEGTGQPKPLERVRQSIKPAAAELPNQTFATHNWLTEPAPCPPLLYIDANGQTVDVVVANGRTTIINLWASWCQPCLEELTEWSDSYDDFRQQDVHVLALCTDGVSEIARSKSQAFLQAIEFRGNTGDASPQLLDTLQQFQNVIYDHHRPLPVPTTILLDKDGQVRAFYKGNVSSEKLLFDVARINSTAEDKENKGDGLPFPGIWLGEQGPHGLSLLAEELFRDGYHAEATAYVERWTADRLKQHQIKARLFLAKEQSTTEKVESLRQLLEVLKLDPKNTSAHEQLGLLMARAGRKRESLHHFEQAVVNADQPPARSYFNYARSLRENGFVEPAMDQFKRAIQANPRFAPAFEQLGLIRASQGDFEQAVIDFGHARRLQPNVVRHSVNLAMALNEVGNFEEAWRQVKAAATSDQPPQMALLTAARSLEQLEQREEAIRMLERFLKREPDAESVRRQLVRMRSKSASRAPTE